MFKLFRKYLLLFVLVPLLAGLLAACGDDDDGGDGEATQPAATTAATEPSGDGEIDISGVEELEDGVLGIGSDIAYAPVEFLDETTNEPVGLDIDVANAIAAVLGVEAEFTNGTFDGLIPALQASRHDVLMSAMFVNEERSQIVDFVEYFLAGSGIIVPEGNPDAVEGLDDLCGLTVATQEGTTHVDVLETQSTECTGAGEEAINVLRFPTDPEAVQALLAGQADAEVADYPVAVYSVEQNEGNLAIEIQVEPTPYGIAIRKESTALRDALQEAFDQIVADGTYAEILDKWNLADGSIE